MGDLSKIMHDINTAYAMYFNRKHEYVGHPFQGRYKAILVEADIYALEVTAYVHLNPVRAKIVERPEDYIWSNFREYIGMEAPKSWTSCSIVLGQFGASPEFARGAYQSFVNLRMARNMPSPIDSASDIGILGDAEFIERMKTEHLLTSEDPYNREFPQINRLIPQPRLEDIREICASIFCLESRYARKAAIYLSHKMTRLPLKTIGEFYAISISGVTDICRRISKEIVANVTLSSNITEIEKLVRRRLLPPT